MKLTFIGLLQGNISTASPYGLYLMVKTMASVYSWLTQFQTHPLIYPAGSHGLLENPPLKKYLSLFKDDFSITTSICIYIYMGFTIANVWLPDGIQSLKESLHDIHPAKVPPQLQLAFFVLHCTASLRLPHQWMRRWPGLTWHLVLLTAWWFIPLSK